MKTCQACGTDVLELNAFCTTCGARMADQVFVPMAEAEEVQSNGEKLISDLAQDDAEAAQVSTAKSDQAQLKSLNKLKVELEKSRLEVAARIEEREKLRASLDAWSHANTNSYLWRTFSTMQKNLERTETVLNEYEAIVAGLTIPDSGVMHTLRKSFHRRLLATFTTLPSIMALFLYIPTLITKIVGHPGVVTFLSSISFSPVRIYSVGIGTMLILILLALTAYYRGWSTYQAKVNRTLWELSGVAQNAAHVRSEQIRLKSVYPQLREWLEIMGHSLTNPWKVNPKWSEASSADIDQESLPYSMHIAQTSEDDGPAMRGMQRYAAERFMMRGWRSRVFAEQVETIQEALGLSKDRLNVELLDSDIAYAPNGPRAMVKSNIADKKILEQVAYKQLVPLTLQIQKEAIANTKPQVHEVRKGQVDALAGPQLTASSSDMPWDDFLSMSLGGASKLTSPFALHALSDSGQVAGHQSRADSFFIVPQRLANKVPSGKPQNLKTYSENTSLPMDIVVRLDFSGPIPDENLILLATKSEKASARSTKTASESNDAPRESGI